MRSVADCVDDLLCICTSEYRTQFCDVPEVKTERLAQMFDVSLIRQVRVYFNPELGNRCCH